VPHGTPGTQAPRFPARRLPSDQREPGARRVAKAGLGKAFDRERRSDRAPLARDSPDILTLDLMAT